MLTIAYIAKNQENHVYTKYFCAIIYEIILLKYAACSNMITMKMLNNISISQEMVVHFHNCLCKK